jgi:hypothetical protein
MEKEALKRIFEFLEDKGGHNAPFMWKLINNEPLTKEDLNIKGDLDLSQTQITSLPEGLKVGGDLYLMFSTISSLPEGLKVGGTLDLMELNIETLPEGLKVGDNLVLSFSLIQTLPKGLKVGDDLYIYGTPLTKYSDEELREMIKPGFIKGIIVR